MKFLNPSFLFALVGILIFVFVMSSMQENISFQQHDSYLEISKTSIAIFFLMLFQFFAMIYFLLSKFNLRINDMLSYTHFILTTLGITGLLIPVIDDEVIVNEIALAQVIVACFLVLILSQVIFILNLSIGIFRKLKNK